MNPERVYFNAYFITPRDTLIKGVIIGVWDKDKRDLKSFHPQQAGFDKEAHPNMKEGVLAQVKDILVE